MEKSFWIISAPKEKEDVFVRLNRQTAKETNLSVNYKFAIPDLKVGTLDSLMALSDDLGKIDHYVESIARKIVQQLLNIVEKKPEKNDSLNINGTAVDTYLTHFQWEESKYPIRSSLKELTDKINQQVAKLDEELKVKATDYNSVSSNIAAEERKKGGTFLVRSLADLVKPTDLQETEYLSTLMVVVPKTLYREWISSYETLTNYVLPRSSKLLAEDQDYGLYSVTLFKRVVEDFKNIAREKRFTVREFKLEEEGNATKERSKMVTEEDRQRKHLVRWCKTNFAEAFVAWIHLKAIRVFVESVLRYGLPINFQAILMQPLKKDDKQIKAVLLKEFGHLANMRVLTQKDEDGSAEKFYPYVYVPVPSVAPQ